MSAASERQDGPRKIALGRDCAAVQIPYGHQVTLRSGTEVVVTQSLGDTFTLQTQQGYLVRIEAKDADAIGLHAIAAAAAPKGPEQVDPHAKVEEAALWEAMKSCYDPEIPVNIVDLGLIYACRIGPTKIPDTPGVRVEVDMTLTAPGCGMGEVLKDDVERKVQQIPGVGEVMVELVFDPAWSAEMMSEAARLELGMF